MTPIVVFNPHSWESTAEVELELGRLHDTDTLLDDEGRAVPWQRVASHATVSGLRARLNFIARLPALGYRVYRVVPRPAGRPA